VPPVACLGIFPTYPLLSPFRLWHNSDMRWILAIIVMILGLALGLGYGWVVDPVKFSDTTPASLRSDYRTDYVLMVAETYHARHDSEFARRQLALLGSRSPAEICGQAVEEARRAGYSPNDLDLLEELLRALQPYVPTPTAGESAP